MVVLWGTMFQPFEKAVWQVFELALVNIMVSMRMSPFKEL